MSLCWVGDRPRGFGSDFKFWEPSKHLPSVERSDVLSFFIFLGPYDVKRATAQITSKEKSILEPRLMVFSKARVTARAALTRNWWFDTLVMVDWAWTAARDR